MRDSEQILQRIFTLARRAPARDVPEAPFGLETAVLAHWREAVSARSTDNGLVRGLRWAALLACAIALLAGALENDQLSAFQNRNDPESRVADSAIVAGYGNE